MRFLLQPGRYYAGIDRPWFVSKGAVRSSLSDYGASQVTFFDRGTPPPVNPQSDQAYSDEWDEWVEVVFPGEARAVETEKRWAWLVHVPAQVYQPQAPQPQDYGPYYRTPRQVVRPLPSVPVPLSAYLPV